MLSGENNQEARRNLLAQIGELNKCRSLRETEFVVRRIQRYANQIIRSEPGVGPSVQEQIVGLTNQLAAERARIKLGGEKDELSESLRRSLTIIAADLSRILGA